MSVPNPTLATRLWQKVNKNGPLILATRCWVWTGYICKQTGYGKIANRPGSPIGTHVAAFLLERGGVPADQAVLHRCDNRPCVRHLYAGTQLQNVADMFDRDRFVNWKDDVVICPQGHDYDSTDTEGYRSCSTCRGFQARQQSRINRARAGKIPRFIPCSGCEYAAARCRCKALRLGSYLPIVTSRKAVA